MTPEDSRSIMLAEYAALRSEITTFLSLQIQFMSFSITLGGVIAGIAIQNHSFGVAASFPLPFLIFGLLYMDVKGRILRAAKYIYTKLRPTLTQNAEGAPLLTWEAYIRDEHELKPLLSVVDNLRVALFLVPLSVVPFILWEWKTIQPQHWLLVGSVITLELILLFFFVRISAETGEL